MPLHVSIPLTISRIVSTSWFSIELIIFFHSGLETSSARELDSFGGIKNLYLAGFFEFNFFFI